MTTLKRWRISAIAASLILLLGLGVSSYSYWILRQPLPTQVALFSGGLNRALLPTRVDGEVFIPNGSELRLLKMNAEKVSYSPYPDIGEHIGDITLPSLGLIWPIFQGTSESELGRGVGHYLQSVLPGQSDNTVLAGHRETVFNRLGELKVGQKILIRTSVGLFKYEIRRFRVVDRSDKSVIVPTSRGVLTLATCYPFNYVGVTNQSFIVVADLVA